MRGIGGGLGVLEMIQTQYSSIKFSKTNIFLKKKQMLKGTDVEPFSSGSLVLYNYALLNP